MSEEIQRWDKIITTKRKLLDLRLKQVWKYRELVALFIKRDIIIYYKQTILGPLWFVIQPLLSSIMYMLIFGRLANIGTDGIPQILFYFSGTMLWTFFSDTLLMSSNVFIENKAIFGKIYFPRLVVPIAYLGGQIVKLLIQFILFIGIYIYFLINGGVVMFSLKILAIPGIILWIGIIGMGLGLIISAITTKYRDLALTLSYLISLLMYATPVVYPLSEVPESLQSIVLLNPVSIPIELFRICFFDMGNVSIFFVAYSIVASIFIVIIGLILFNKNEQVFVDVI